MTNGGRIPETIIADVKRSNDIVAVVEEYVTLSKKTGANFFGLCPFHNEVTPSFSVAPDKQIFYCFGCHRGGDVIKFISEIEKLNYPEAIRFLAKRVNITIPETDVSPYDAKRRSLQKQIESMYLEAAKFYYRALERDPEHTALKYCVARGITPISRRSFGIGFAPNTWDALYKHFELKHLTRDKEALEKSGLFTKNKYGGYCDRMRNRLIFPFFDTTGKIIAFGGRIMNADKAQAKYLNSPETPIYTKGDHLYGLHLARKTKSNHILLVEGYMDVISAHAAGADFTVASLGTALTKRQARILGNLHKTITLAFDSDAAGQSAIMRSIDILAEEDIPTDILLLPDGKDPDEYIRKNGAAAFLGLTQKTVSVLDFKLHLAKENAIVSGQLDKRRYQENVFAILRQEKNSLLVDSVLNNLSIELGCRLQLLINDYQAKNRDPAFIRQLTSNQDNFPERKSGEGVASTSDISNSVPETLGDIELQLNIISIILCVPDLITKAKFLPQADDFSDRSLGLLFMAIKTLAPGKPDFTTLIGLTQVVRDFPESYYKRIMEICVNFEISADTVKKLEKNSLILMRDSAADKLNRLAQRLHPDNKIDAGLKQEIQTWSQKIIEYKQLIEQY